MKTRIHIILLAVLLLLTISVGPVICQEISKSNSSGLVMGDCSEEIPEKSSEENAKEIDQEEDFFKINDTHLNSISGLLNFHRNNHYSFGFSIYYPEIVSPPPQS